MLNFYTFVIHDLKFIQDVFLQYLLATIAAKCDNSNKSDELLVNGRDRECHEAIINLLVTVKCTRLMRLARWGL